MIEQKLPKKGKSRSKIRSLPPEIYEKIRDLTLAHRKDLVYKTVSAEAFFETEIYPLLPKDSGINETHFLFWMKTLFRGKYNEDTSEDTLLERENKKLRKQIEIRQDAADMMGDFLQSIRQIASDPNMLRKMAIDPTKIYKIIREEEDRSKLVGLQERAENRADLQFAFIVSMARAGQLTDDDIQFLGDDIKQELAILKQENGIYQLPVGNPLAEVQFAAKNPGVVAGEVNPEGAA